MSAIHIRTTLASDTPHLPELAPLVGRAVEIVVREDPTPVLPPELTAGPLADPAAESARMRALLDWIVANRVKHLAPGTPDSTEMLREDRAR